MSQSSARDPGSLLSGSFFCVKPWVHCHVRTSGELHPCCMSPVRLGNVKQQSLAAIWNGEAMRRLRRQHLSGEKVPGCEVCYAREEVGSQSMRTEANADFGARARDWLINTGEDGSSPDSRPVDYDIRFSNICNFKCRTCNHSLSSSWHADQVAAYGRLAGPKAIIRVFDEPKDFWRAFDGFVESIEKVYFAGGEPLLQDEHYEVLQALRAHRKFDVLIHYNTNFSVLRHRGQDVTMLWRDFRRLHVAASLDGSGRRGEFIRHGQSWADVLANRETLRKACPNAKFWVACAVSALNVWHAPDFHRELIELGFIEPADFEINIVYEPGHLSAQVLPTAMKNEVCAKIAEHVRWLNERDEGDVARGFETISRYLMDRDATGKLPRFREFCQELDRRRGERTLEVLPELAPVMAL